MNFGIIIPAQFGGEAYDRNPLQPFGNNGESLLEWKINQVKEMFSNDDIFVSSSSNEILSVAKSTGVNIIKRDDNINTEYKRSFGSVITEIVKDIDREHIVWISPTHPFMNEGDYSKAILIYEKMISEKTHDSLMSVFEMDDYIWVGDQPINYSANQKQEYRDNLLPTYKVTNGLFIRSKENILSDAYYLGDRVYKLKVNKLAAQDIDSKEDMIIANSLVSHYEDIKRSNQCTIFLDFDGVIVDSAKEAYAMAMLTTGKIKLLSELDLNSEHANRFLQQRCHIGPAWNYYYLLKAIDENKDSLFTELLPSEAGKDSKSFQEQFFATRQVIRNHFWDEWLSLNTLYNGSDKLINLINENDNIVIVTTKDAQTVDALLTKYKVTRKVDIYDAKSYEEFGCKSLFMDDYIKNNAIKRSLFIDDSKSHLSKCSWIEGLKTIQAQWGYVLPEDYMDNKDEVIKSIMDTLRG